MEELKGKKFLFIIRKILGLIPAFENVFEVVLIIDDHGFINVYRLDGRYYTPEKVIWLCLVNYVILYCNFHNSPAYLMLHCKMGCCSLTLLLLSSPSSTRLLLQSPPVLLAKCIIRGVDTVLLLMGSLHGKTIWRRFTMIVRDRWSISSFAQYWCQWSYGLLHC